MKLDNIYITGETLDKLCDKLEAYNKDKTPENQITFQEICERALKHWIRYGNISVIDDYI